MFYLASCLLPYSKENIYILRTRELGVHSGIDRETGNSCGYFKVTCKSKFLVFYFKVSVLSNFALKYFGPRVYHYNILNVLLSVLYNMSRSRPSFLQMEKLIEFLENNPGITTGHMRSAQARHVAKMKWDEITLELNSMGGTIKDSKSWAKVSTTNKHH